MLKIATKKYDNLEVSDLELNLDKNLDAIDVFKMINDKYSNTDIYYIIGADNLYKMLLWKDFNNLVKDYKYIVVERELLDCEELIKSNETLTKYKNNFNIVENKHYNKASATNAREKIQSGNMNGIEENIPKDIIEYIKENKLYN